MSSTNHGSTSQGSAKESSAQQSVWVEQIEVVAGQLYKQVKRLLNDGNVRQIVIRRPNDAILLEIPLTAGAVGIGVLTLILPHIVALVAVAGLFAKFKLDIVRVEAPPADTAEEVQEIEVEPVKKSDN